MMIEKNFSDLVETETSGSSHPEENSINLALKAYLVGQLKLDLVVDIIAKPIEEAFSSADHGRAILRAEETAKDQRQYFSDEAGESCWGKPLSQSELPVIRPEDEHKPMTESLLWELYFAVIKAARDTSWLDEDMQEKLLDLVKAIRDRPDPGEPMQLTRALRNDWIWGDNHLWSSLKILGPSARESWNDSPGDGASLVERHAWANVNAFTARLTRCDVFDFWIYAIWALREGLEELYTNVCASSRIDRLEASIPAAAVWVLVLGEKLYNREVDLTPENEGHGRPGKGGELWQGRDEFSRRRWALWKSRFRVLKNDESISAETRKVAAQAESMMEKIENCTKS